LKFTGGCGGAARPEPAPSAGFCPRTTGGCGGKACPGPAASAGFCPRTTGGCGGAAHPGPAASAGFCPQNIVAPSSPWLGEPDCFHDQITVRSEFRL